LGRISLYSLIRIKKPNAKNTTGDVFPSIIFTSDVKVEKDISPDEISYSSVIHSLGKGDQGREA